MYAHTHCLGSLAGIISKFLVVKEEVSFHILSFQVDARDGRPCTFPGRLLLHPTSNNQLWNSSALVKNGRTAEADMLHAREMIQVEDISADALPSTVDDDGCAGGPEISAGLGIG